MKEIASDRNYTFWRRNYKRRNPLIRRPKLFGEIENGSRKIEIKLSEYMAHGTCNVMSNLGLLNEGKWI